MPQPSATLPSEPPPGAPTLRPGDVLLYSSSGLLGWLIKTKTWSPVSHTETYIGNGLSAASRNGIGVGTYPVRWDDLLEVRRPSPLTADQLAAGLEWHQSVCGQGYDWLGLLSFFFAEKGGHSEKMFCSEHTARLANRFQLWPFGPLYDCDKVSPGMFRASPTYRLAWTAPEPVGDRYPISPA